MNFQILILKKKILSKIPQKSPACYGNEIEIEDEDDKEDYEWEFDCDYDDDDERAGVDCREARIRVFILSYQYTVYLPIDVGEYFANLQTYIVDSSSLEEILEGDFDGLENLKRLVITGNSISNIDQGVFDGLEELEEIDMSDNGIGFFPNR